MAESFLDKLLSAVGTTVSGLPDDAAAIMRGMYEETFNPEGEEVIPFSGAGQSTDGSGRMVGRTPITDESQAQDMGAVAQRLQFLMNATGAPLRALDRASEAAFGSPLVMSRNRPLTSAVTPGVSDAEERQASAKLMEAVAARERKMEEIKSREQAAVEARRAQLAAASSPDTLSFAAIGSNVVGDKVPGSKGQFSRTKGSSEESRAVAKLVKEGVPAEMAPAMFALSRAKSKPEMAAAELRAKMAVPQEKGAEMQNLITAAMKSEDPMAAMRLVKVALRMRGIPDETIDALFKQAEK